MKLSAEKITALLSDEYFIHWVLNPDAASNAYWQKRLSQRPEEKETLLTAKAILIKSAEKSMPANTEILSAEIWGKIIAEIEHKKISQLDNTPTKNYQAWLWAAACIVTIIVSFKAINFLHAPQKPAKLSIVSTIENNQLKRVNTTAENRVVYLVDGTKITLQPGSSIHYTTFLAKEKREIYLEGDAFFEVAKDAQRPFYVYEKNLSLRVVGTSFSVKADKTSGDISVAVRTGKVSIFTSRSHVLLTPNQKAVCKNKTSEIIRLDTAIINKQVVTKPEASEVDFTFDDTPAASIFTTMQDAYGIKINFDAAALSNCRITSSLNDETFENKLIIICKTINASYYIKNNEVFINGGGCS